MPIRRAPPVLAVLLAGLPAFAGCVPGSALGSPLSARDSTWLAEVGFHLREPDALLHLDRAEIRRLAVDSTAQLLARAPRVEVRLRQDGLKDYLLHRSEAWRSADSADPGCPLSFYVNGSETRIRARGIVELQRDRIVRPHQITGLEIFAMENAPVTPPGGCGAILFWVAEGRLPDDPDFTAVVHGRVRRVPEGEGVEGIEVTLEPGGLRRATAANGRFDFGALPPAVYRLHAEVPDWGAYDTELPLRAGAVAEIEIEVEKR